MPRRKDVPKRSVQPDPVYRSQVLAKFINHLMVSGKRSVAEGIMYDALDMIKERTHCDPLVVFEIALANIKPVVEVKSRRVGGATYQVPVEVRLGRASALAMRWLVDCARQRNEKGMVLRLVGEILDAADLQTGASASSDEAPQHGPGKGHAVKKKEDMHRMAEANRAFSHYRV